MKSLSRFVPVLCVFVGTLVPFLTQSNGSKDDEWVSLFDGKSLDGWTPKIKGYDYGVNYADTFRVKDGAISVSYDKYEDSKFGGKFGHLFYKVPYSHYRFKMEYRFLGDQLSDGPGWATRNSGVMIHGQVGKSMGKEQDFPVSIEVQLLGGLGNGDRPTANLCTPGTNVWYQDKLWTQHCTNSSSKTYHGDEWVEVEIEIHGNDRIVHFVNGEKVLEYSRPQLDPNDADAKNLIHGDNLMLESGSISLQSESHPVEFRNIKIKELSH